MLRINNSNDKTNNLEPKLTEEEIKKLDLDSDRTKKLMEKQKLVEIDITDKDNAIDELFKKADEEHKLVQKYYNENQKKHEKYIKLVNELSVSIAEANKKHEQYIEMRNEAQKVHEKAFEMRSKIVSFYLLLSQQL